MASNPPTPPPVSVPPVPIVSARDADVSGLFLPDFGELYEIHSYRNAAQILATTCAAEFREIVGTLLAFRIPTADTVVAGGNKSKIVLGIEGKLKPLGWLEIRIVGDL